MDFETTLKKNNGRIHVIFRGGGGRGKGNRYFLNIFGNVFGRDSATSVTNRLKYHLDYSSIFDYSLPITTLTIYMHVYGFETPTRLRKKLDFNHANASYRGIPLVYPPSNIQRCNVGQCRWKYFVSSRVFVRARSIFEYQPSYHRR